MKEGNDDQRPQGRGCAETNAARRAPLRAKGAPGWRQAERAARDRHDAQAEQASGAPSGTWRGGLQAAPWRQDTRAARTPKKKTVRALALDAYTSPFSAIDRIESPATIR